MAVTFSAVLLGGIEPLAPVTVALIKNSSSHWLPPSCGHLRVEDDNEVSCEGEERSRCLCKVQAQHKARASAGHTHRQGLGSPAASLRRFGHQASVALQSASSSCNPNGRSGSHETVFRVKRHGIICLSRHGDLLTTPVRPRRVPSLRGSRRLTLTRHTRGGVSRQSLLGGPTCRAAEATEVCDGAREDCDGWLSWLCLMRSHAGTRGSGRRRSRHSQVRVLHCARRLLMPCMCASAP